MRSRKPYWDFGPTNARGNLRQLESQSTTDQRRPIQSKPSHAKHARPTETAIWPNVAQARANMCDKALLRNLDMSVHGFQENLHIVLTSTDVKYIRRKTLLLLTCPRWWTTINKSTNGQKPNAFKPRLRSTQAPCEKCHHSQILRSVKYFKACMADVQSVPWS